MPNPKNETTPKRTWNRTDRVNLDQRTANRARVMGAIGERLAAIELTAHGFTSIRNLNIYNRRNNPGSDIYAERGDRKFWVSVKIRNKYTIDGETNNCYRLKQPERLHLLKDERDHPGTEAACIAISLIVSGRWARDGEPPNSYSCYFSTLRNLTGKTGIPMLEKHLRRYECLALNEPIPSAFDVADLENLFERRTPNLAGMSPRPIIGGSPPASIRTLSAALKENERLRGWLAAIGDRVADPAVYDDTLRALAGEPAP